MLTRSTRSFVPLSNTKRDLSWSVPQSAVPYHRIPGNASKSARANSKVAAKALASEPQWSKLKIVLVVKKSRSSFIVNDFVYHNDVVCFLLQAQRIQAESIARSHSTILEEKLSELALERQRLQVRNAFACTSNMQGRNPYKGDPGLFVGLCPQGVSDNLCFVWIDRIKLVSLKTLRKGTQRFAECPCCI